MNQDKYTAGREAGTRVHKALSKATKATSTTASELLSSVGAKLDAAQSALRGFLTGAVRGPRRAK